jgi:isopenicillin N synthase-like dioxygenase
LQQSFFSTSEEEYVSVVDFEPFLKGDEADQVEVARKIGNACRHNGFLILTGHQVSKPTIDAAWQSARNYFDLPEEVKVQGLMTDGNPYGYSPFGGEILSKGKDHEDGKENLELPDLKESFSVGPYNAESGVQRTLFPFNGTLSGFEGNDSTRATLQAFEQDSTAYFQEMEKLAEKVLESFSIALDLPSRDWFKPMTDKHCSALRIINYPHIDDPEAFPENQVRASAHTDYGVITILRQDPSPGSVQVIHRQTKEWIPVQYIEDAFIINLGDLMARWTNDQWVSTMHRVVKPPSDNEQDSRRQSFAFFHNLNKTALVETIPTCVDESNPAKYPPINAMDHLMEKHLAATSGVSMK